MGLNPPSSRDAFKDAASFYDRELAPLLSASENRRRIAVRQAALISGASLFVAALSLKFGGDNAFVGVMLSAIIGFGAAGARISKTRGEITHDVLSRIAAHFGFHYLRKRSRPNYCEPLITYGLLPRFDMETWEDEIVGRHKDAAFTLAEAHLQKRPRGKKKRPTTVFHGQVLAIDYDATYSGTTIIKRDSGVLNRFEKPGENFQRIGLASSKFEKAFEAWSTDQVEARTLLDPVMLERFEELDRLFDGAKFRAAFTGGKLYVAVETGDKMDIGGMFRPIEGPDRIEKILKEFDLIFDLIDVATQRINAPLNEAFSVKHVRQA